MRGKPLSFRGRKLPVKLADISQVVELAPRLMLCLSDKKPTRLLMPAAKKSRRVSVAETCENRTHLGGY
ncbi:MAG TPA: hypothetical protein GX728_04505 [Clostridiaceae bacterium]|jgi:hypothetical protein|nr:hypothetical protein [Clostridiaceae bacterium]